MRINFSILLAVALALPTFTAPISNDNVRDASGLEVRAAKAAAKKTKAVVPAKPKKAPVPPKKAAPAKKAPAPPKKAPLPPKKAVPAKKAPAPPKKAPLPPKKAVPAKKAPAPVPPKKAVPAKKAPVPAKKAPVPAKAPIPAKKGVPQTSVAGKTTKAPTVKTPTTAKAPVTSCPIPARKTPARRFLEYVGLLRRSTTVPDGCAGAPVAETSNPVAGTSNPSTSTSSAPLTAAQKKNAKTAARKKAAKAAAQAAQGAEASQSAAAPVPAPPVAPAPPVVANRPTTAIQCPVRGNGPAVTIPLADLDIALSLAQAGPVQTDTTFPHKFLNDKGGGKREVNVATACRAAGLTLLEQAVGPGMASFVNTAGDPNFRRFNQFRVIITKPDAKGDTTFCGVMTHGPNSSGAGFDAALCKPV